MSQLPIADTTARAITLISVETGIEEAVVKQVVDAYVAKIMLALSKEVPFAIRGFAKIFHRYVVKEMPHTKREHYNDKVHREVAMSLFPDAKARLHGWVHDIGIKNNKKEELLKIKIKPEEIEKIRRRRVLQDQRSLGFRSELLFESSPEADSSFEQDLGDAPTVEEITRRIGMNLGD